MGYLVARDEVGVVDGGLGHDLLHVRAELLDEGRLEDLKECLRSFSGIYCMVIVSCFSP